MLPGNGRPVRGSQIAPGSVQSTGAGFKWLKSPPLSACVGTVVACTIKGCLRTGQVERTRREIAAYVAEGSISPEDGERLMCKAGHESLINKL